MNNIAVIPARMGATRFPGKPMVKIGDMPMIGHVFLRTQNSNLFDQVFVATCDSEIQDYIKSIGGAVILTSPEHERATERVGEAVEHVERDYGTVVKNVVMVQGDEPMVTSQMLDLVFRALLNDTEEVVNLISPIRSIEEYRDTGNVKVVFTRESYALYFSREPIPSAWKGEGEDRRYKQTGIIGFTRSYLPRYNELPQTALEKIESVDMNRVLETGGRIKVVVTDQDCFSVDTSEDLRCVEKAMFGLI